MFLDVTNYLKVYKKTAKELAKEILNDILLTTGVTATVGIGTNLYLAKIALDIIAKHSKDNIGYLDEESYKTKLWHHTPITDFWQVGEGIAKRLAKHGIIDMYGVGHADEKVLYKEFGINAEYLIDHAKGIEPTTIEDIKKYKPKAHSLSQGQVLLEDYTYDKALIVLKEMVDSLSLELIDKHLVAGSIGLGINYSKEIYPSTGGTRKMHLTTNVFSVLEEEVTRLYESTTRKEMPIRKINVSFSDLIDADFEQLDLLTDRAKIEKERKTQKAMNQIKTKFGKNAVMRGMNKKALQKLNKGDGENRK